MDAHSVGEMVLREGQTVTVTRGATSATVKAKIREGTPETVAGDRHVARHKLTFTPIDPGWAGFPVPPLAGDTVAFDGRDHLLDGVKSPKSGDETLLYVATSIG